MRRALLFVALWSLIPPEASGSYGGRAGSLYRFGLGTRPLGFGGAVVSLAHDPATILVNPAGAAFSGSGSLVGSHTWMALDRSINVVGVARQIDANAGISVAWVNAGVDNVPGYDMNGDPTGTLDNGENTVVVTFANRFGPVAAGASAKWYRYRLADHTSSGWTLDVGLMATPLAGVRVGLAMRDLVGALVWTTEREQGQSRTEDTFPRTITVGGSYYAALIRTTFAADYENVDQEGDYLHVGVSWKVVEPVHLRAGYRWIELTESAHDPTFTAGLTVTTDFGDSQVSFDYGVLDEPLGLVHSLGIRLGM